MTDDLQQFFRKMAEEEAEAGESADGGTAGESMDNDADMLANVADPAPRPARFWVRKATRAAKRIAAAAVATAVDPPVPIRAVRAAAAVATAVDPPVPIRAVRAAAAERRSAVAWQCFWSSSPWCWSWSSSP